MVAANSQSQHPNKLVSWTIAVRHLDYNAHDLFVRSANGPMPGSPRRGRAVGKAAEEIEEPVVFPL